MWYGSCDWNVDIPWLLLDNVWSWLILGEGLSAEMVELTIEQDRPIWWYFEHWKECFYGLIVICYFLLVEDIVLHIHYKLYYSTLKTPLKPLFQLVSAIFYFCTLLLIAFQKLWKMLFISSKKLFSFWKYSNFCNILSPFPHFADAKGQLKLE